jgi:polyhydroxybutyrate depolymerase
LQADGCGGPVSGEWGDPLVTSLDATECTDHTAVVYLEIQDAGHQWPGAASSEIRDELGGDPPSTRLDATHELAAFFGAHPGS